MLPVQRSRTRCPQVLSTISSNLGISSCGSGKRCDGAVTGVSCPRGDALLLQMLVDGRPCTALLDSGCSVTLVKKTTAAPISHKPVRLETMNGGQMETQGRVLLRSLKSGNKELGPVTAYVVPHLPLGVDIVLGLPLLRRHGCWIGEIKGKVDVRWGLGVVGLSADPVKHGSASTIEDKDFVAWFEEGSWHMVWKWKEATISQGPVSYSIKRGVESSFDAEIEQWISEGILVRWDESTHGPVKHFMPLMAVVQRKGEVEKVRPVLDYRLLNSVIESRPGGAMPLCRERLREWRKKGLKCSVIDLRKAYLQVRVDPSLWCFQAVKWHGEIFLLTRLGFGLSVAPKVMSAIVSFVLQQDTAINRAASAYVDDIYIDETIVDANSVVAHFRNYGLNSKEPIRLGVSDGVRVLGLRVDEDLNWQRDSSLPEVPVSSKMTRRDVHRLIGEWLGHHPVGGWLRVACAFLQRLTALDGKAWDEPVSDDIITKVSEVDERLRSQGDPMKGKWPVDPEMGSLVWADASHIAVGVALEVAGDIVEDACWLRSKVDSAHINIAELDAVIRGMNLAVSWDIRKFCIMTDSATVSGWLMSVVENTHNVRTRALSELLIRRRLDIIRELISQERLQVTVRLIPSHANKADALTRVPKKWIPLPSTPLPQEREVAAVATVGSRPNLTQLKELHDHHHFGVDRTLALSREAFGDDVSRKQVRKVVSRCEQCARIDPAVTFRWEAGRVTVPTTRHRLATDIAHVAGKPWVTVVDCGSGFTSWFKLGRESACEVIRCLLMLITMMGPPSQLLSDNGTVFRSKEFKEFLSSWDVDAVQTCAWRPQGNGCVERNHRTIKRMVARTWKSVESCAFWYNVTQGGQGESPYETVFSAKSKIPSVRRCRQAISRVIGSESQAEISDRGTDRNPFVLGDLVYLRPPEGRCYEPRTGPHKVTSIHSAVSIELNDDGVSRHISHVRRKPERLEPLQEAVNDDTSDDDETPARAGGTEPTQDATTSPSPLRRSARIRQRQRCDLCASSS